MTDPPCTHERLPDSLDTTRTSSHYDAPTTDIEIPFESNNDTREIVLHRYALVWNRWRRPV
jgi:hypothetical protein